MSKEIVSNLDRINAYYIRLDWFEVNNKTKEDLSSKEKLIWYQIEEYAKPKVTKLEQKIGTEAARAYFLGQLVGAGMATGRYKDTYNPYQ